MGKLNHKELIVWQKAMLLAEMVYKLVKLLPKEELYALSDQMRRAVISIPSNIAEGNARNSTREFLQFLSVANGSLAELETQLLLCTKINYLTMEQIQPTLNLMDELAKMLSGMKNALRQKL